VRSTALVIVIVAGCAPEALYLPDAAEIGTVGVLVEGAPRTLHLAPFDAAAPALPLLEGEAEGTLYALYFPRSYAMPRGTFTEGDSPLWSRPLPPPQQVLTRGWSDDAWAPLSAESTPSFELAVESPIECAERGGCYEDDNARACTVPCPPAPQPEPVSPPQPPRYQPCPFGWTDDPALRACHGPTAPCPGEQRRSAGETACRAPGPPTPPPGDDWPQGLDEQRTRFVRTGALGGDGSRAQPWGSLDQALGRGPADITLALARGTYSLPPELGGVSRILGLSTTETRLVASATVSVRQGLTLAALTLDTPLLRTHGTARLDGVVLTGALVVDDGELTLFDVLAEGRVRVRGGHLVVRDTWLVAPLLALDVDGGGSALVEESSLRGGLYARGAVTVRDSVLRSTGHPALIVQQAEVILSGVDLDADGTMITTLVSSAATLSGSRVLFGPGQTALDAAPSAQVLLEDVVFAGGSRTLSSRALHGFDAQITLRRARVEAPYSAAIELDGAASQLTLEDYSTTSSRAGALDIVAGLQIALRRVEIHGFNVFKLLNPRGMSLPWSLDAEDVRLEDGLIRLRGANNARFTRLRAVGGRGVALMSEATPDPPTLDLSDIHISGSITPQECGFRAICSGSGVQATGPIRLERYRMEGNAGPAVTVIDPPSKAVLVRSGVVAHQRVALALDGPKERLWSMMVGLQLDDVPFACDPCGE
jgi:hypothetical protein